MTHLKLLAVGALVSGAVFAAPLASQQILVTPDEGSVDRYVEEVSHDLDTALSRVIISAQRVRGGTAKVRFNADEDGDATNITLYERSGDPHVDRAAMRAVRRLTSLPDFPKGVPDTQVIQANIVLATTDSQRKMLLRDLAREEAARLASSNPKERAVLALNMVSGIGS